MIDKDRTYRTRDGREVRIYATDGRGGTAIHGAIKTCSGHWQQESWFSNGQLLILTILQSDSDLIEVRPRHKRVVWVNVYEDSKPALHLSRELADQYCCDRTACIKVELDFEEGQGL